MVELRYYSVGDHSVAVFNAFSGGSLFLLSFDRSSGKRTSHSLVSLQAKHKGEMGLVSSNLG